jgi:Domain of unknown function (DUF222)
LSRPDHRLERMFEKVRNARDLLREALAELEPEVLEGKAAARLVEEFAEVERLGAAGKALAARRVADSGAWRATGERSPAHWMAKTTKTSVGSAVGVLETAARVAELPATEEAVRAGRLSEAQAREIASAAAASPSSESELLKTAENDSLGGLRDRCAQVRAAALPDEAERYARIRARRRLRHWSDPDGAFRLDALLTPDAGATVLAALEPLRERIFADAGKQGRREAYEAYGADALVAMADHQRDCGEVPQRKGPGALVHVVVDHAALLRGSVEDGETCEIRGVGPVPAETARALASDAFLAALVCDGTDIKNVSHLGKNIPARLRSAVVTRDRACVVPGCDVAHHLEIDHIRPRKPTRPGDKRGPTQLDNLARLCSYHHFLKTYRGYRLTGPPGKWGWEPPAPRARAGPNTQ